MVSICRKGPSDESHIKSNDDWHGSDVRMGDRFGLRSRENGDDMRCGTISVRYAVHQFEPSITSDVAKISLERFGDFSF